MVFTASQKISFLEDAYQMGLSNRYCTLWLIIEGIAAVDDLYDSYDNDWDKRNSNLQEAFTGFKIPTTLPISFLKYPLKYQSSPRSA